MEDRPDAGQRRQDGCRSEKTGRMQVRDDRTDAGQRRQDGCRSDKTGRMQVRTNASSVVDPKLFIPDQDLNFPCSVSGTPERRKKQDTMVTLCYGAASVRLRTKKNPETLLSATGTGT